MTTPSEIEKESLEAHVELCAIRYNNLEHKLGNLEHRMDKLENHLVDIKKTLTTTEKDDKKQSVQIAVSIITVLIAGLLGFIANAIFNG